VTDHPGDDGADGPRALDAVVFDFDGLIVDTETPIYEASRAALEGLGHRLSVEAWATVVGHGDEDSFAALCRALDAEVDRDAFDAGYQAQDRSWRDRQPVLPGVVDLLDALAADGVPCGIASSSPMAWIDGHLVRLGLRDRFATIASVDRVGGRAKPAPDAYLLACADLGAHPARSVAIEDSAPGTMAAHAAGLKVVAVPSHITRHTDTSRADLTVASVAELTPAALAALLDRS
jgi:HAD superfamily hydrolase (TIGR01509 family)